jgi:hypothetical protein
MAVQQLERTLAKSCVRKARIPATMHLKLKGGWADSESIQGSSPFGRYRNVLNHCHHECCNCHFG